MHSATTKINKKYFGYAFKKVMPSLLLMTLIMFLVSFCCHMFSDFSTLQGLTLVSAEMMSISTYPFAFIYPTILSILLFSFLHKRQSADFFGGAPITRSQMFLSNTIIAAISFFAMILLNGLFVLTIIFVARPDTAAVLALGEFIRYVIINLVAFMAAYGASSLASSLTGSAAAQFVLAYIIMIIPSLLVNMIQTLPVIDGGNVTVIYSDPAVLQPPVFSSIVYPTAEIALDFSKIFIIPNILSAPFTLLTEIFSKNLIDFYGTTGYFTNIWAIIYNALLACVYTVSGLLIFKKYKLENAGTPFCNKWVFFAAKVSLFAAFFTLLFRLITVFSWDVLIIILFIMSFVAYVILDIIIKKGIRDIGKSLAVFAISVAVGMGIGAMSFGGNVLIRDHLNRLDLNDTDEIESCTVYLPSFNAAADMDLYGIKDAYIPVKISDADIISKLFNPDENNHQPRYYYCTLGLKNGNTVTTKLQLFDVGYSALFKAIAEDETLYMSLFKAPGKHNIEAAYIISSNFSLPIPPVRLSKYDTADIMTEKFDAFKASSAEERADMLAERYARFTDYYDKSTYSYTQHIVPDTEYYSENNEVFIDKTDSLFKSCVVKYVDGKYYTENVAVPNDEKYYPLLEKIAATKKKLKALSTRNGVSVSYIGAIEISDEQPLFMVSKITDMANVAPDIFKEMALKAADLPIIHKNTLCFYIKGVNKVIYLNVDRDIIPALEKYADRILDRIGNYYESPAESYLIALSAVESYSIAFDEDLIWTSHEKYLYKPYDDDFDNETDLDRKTIEAIRADRNSIKECMTRKYDRKAIEYPTYSCSVFLPSGNYIGKSILIPFDANCTEMMKNVDILLERPMQRYRILNKAESAYISEYAVSITEREDVEELAFIAALRDYGNFETFNYNYYDVEFLFHLTQEELIAGETKSEYAFIPIPSYMAEKYGCLPGSAQIAEKYENFPIEY